MLALAAGRDITNMFESYHPFASEHASAVLKKYYVCDVADTELPRYVYLEVQSIDYGVP